MKALTVQQPWAWAIFRGKSVENRIWPTAYRGPLLIHAGKSRRYYDRERPADWKEGYGLDLPPFGDLVTGAVLGVVRLADCVPADPGLPYFLPGVGPNVWAEGPWLWVLESPRLFPAPIPFRGAQGLFEIPDHLIPAEYR